MLVLRFEGCGGETKKNKCAFNSFASLDLVVVAVVAVAAAVAVAVVVVLVVV